MEINFVILVYVISILESGGDRYAVGHDGELGSCQVTKDTHEFLNKAGRVYPTFEFKDHRDPVVSRLYSIAYLKYCDLLLKIHTGLLKDVGDKIFCIAVAYKEGPEYVLKRGSNIEGYPPIQRSYGTRARNLYFDYMEKRKDDIMKVIPIRSMARIIEENSPKDEDGRIDEKKMEVMAKKLISIKGDPKIEEMIKVLVKELGFTRLIKNETE